VSYSPHIGAPFAAPHVDAALAALRQRGLRASAARRLVLEALYAAEEPVSAQRIAGGLDGRLPSSDLSSVYRNLETLEQVGLVRHVHLGHGAGLYDLADHEREYLVCDGCSAVRVVTRRVLDPVRLTIRASFGLEPRFDHFPIVGRCDQCNGLATKEEMTP
jgi:Fur family ferric uptake transcriptional regulator